MAAEGFAAIPNWIVRDSSVSAYAIAVYVALASHTGPGGIHPSRETLALEARCSERSVGNALNELEALGVLERVRRVSSVGRAPTGYMLHPQGRLAPDEVPASDAVTSGGFRHRATSGSGTGEQITPLVEEEPMKKNPGVDEFDRLWAAWPRREGKQAALKAWTKACARVASALAPGVYAQPAMVAPGLLLTRSLPHAERFAARPPSERQFIPHLASWLNGSRWDDEALAGGSSPAAYGGWGPDEAWRAKG